MNRTAKLILVVLIALSAIGLTVFFIRANHPALFYPQGPIAQQERDLIAAAVSLMLLVAIPMLFLLYTFAWKYRAGNENAKREPEHTGNAWRQLLWWIIPAIIIAAIAIINWKSTHALDPYRPIDSNVQPLTIQVVALEWKWLFIYPAQGIATMNFITFPVNTPVHFELTADAPMSSFWIPQLGSQIYTMAAMQTQLNLMASTIGEFTGKDTEINGAGYAGMTFLAKSVSQSDFDAWVASVKQSSTTLDVPTYNLLAAPSDDVPPRSYSSVDSNLYDTILMKFMGPTTSDAPGLPTSTSATTSAHSANENVVTSTPSSTPSPAMPGMSM